MTTFPAPQLRWAVCAEPDPAAVAMLSSELGLPRALAALLVQRGHATPELARRFLKPALSDLADPSSLFDLDNAARAVAEAVTAGRTVMVHGDYDVDGQCATALLTQTLRIAGARVVPFIPHRLRDGYDFGPAGLAAARAAGASLIITCDCGITAVEAVAAAAEAGIGVVVTDHHIPGPVLPAARAVVDPQRIEDHSGLSQLCGTGVAFKLVQALAPLLGLPANLPFHLLDLVALATVADVVPLVGENRILVKHGLKVLQQSRWPGLRALIEVAGHAGRDIRSGQLGFVLGPRLNAAGRIGDPADGLRLLLSTDPAEAGALARRLDALNAERQTLDQRILDEALEQVEQGDPGRDAGLVLTGEGWHPGVVGIVASRVVERYGRPTFLIAFDGEIGKGSGRSISRFNLHSALSECGDLLERFGGHHMAAGVTIRRSRLEEFRDRFARVAREALAPEDLGPEQRVDLVVPLTEVTRDLERLCRHLEPSGSGNPSPVFGVRGVRFVEVAHLRNGHLKGLLDDGHGRVAAIGFHLADRAAWLGDSPVDAAFRIECNEWQGTTTLQARLCALTPAEPR